MGIDGSAGSGSGVVLQVTCSEIREGNRNIDTMIGGVPCVHYRTQG
jgi:hypothetical protein